MDEFLRPRVLQQEAAGAGAQRLVDVVVEVERGEDQHPRVGRRAARDLPGRRDAVEDRHPHVHQDHVGRARARGVRPPRARSPPGPRPPARLGRQQGGEPLPDHRLVVGNEDPDRHSLFLLRSGRSGDVTGPMAAGECHAIGGRRCGRDRGRRPGRRADGTAPNPPSGVCAGLDRAAFRGHALAHAGETVAARGRAPDRAGWRAVADLQLHPAGPRVTRQAQRAGGVPGGIGQRLLDDPVERQLRARPEPRPRGSPPTVEVHAGPPGPVHQVTRARPGCGACAVSSSLPRSTASRARVSVSASRAVALIESSSARRLGQIRYPVARGLGLHDHERHVVGDDVVQVAGDPRPFLQDAGRLLGGAHLLLAAQRAAAARQPPGQPAGHGHGRRRDGPAGAQVVHLDAGRQHQGRAGPHHGDGEPALAVGHRRQQRQQHQGVHHQPRPRRPVAGQQAVRRQQHPQEQRGGRAGQPARQRGGAHQQQRQRGGGRDERDGAPAHPLDAVRRGRGAERDPVQRQRDDAEDHPPQPAAVLRRHQRGHRPAVPARVRPAVLRASGPAGGLLRRTPVTQPSPGRESGHAWERSHRQGAPSSYRGAIRAYPAGTAGRRSGATRGSSADGSAR